VQLRSYYFQVFRLGNSHQTGTSCHGFDANCPQSLKKIRQSDLMAVLMAVRFQLLCFLLRRIATNVWLYIVYYEQVMRSLAAGCSSLQNRQNQT
jgi:hypothetical protein